MTRRLRATPSSKFGLVDVPAEGELRLDQLFGRSAPLEVDLGSGPGSFLIAMAAAHPDRNFLGVERLLKRAGKTCRAVERAGLGNVRVLRREIAETVETRLPAESVTVFYLLFPDPWPKRRHHSRRLLNDAFLRAAWRALRPGGELRMMTDDLSYHEQAGKTASGHPFRELEWPENPEEPRTDFERRYLAEDRVVYRLRLRKITT